MNMMHAHHWVGGHYINSPLFVGPLFSLVLLAAVWTLFWKGLALWHAGRRGDGWWFVILLLVNTLGILEIIYLFVVAKLALRDLFTKHVHHTHG